MIQTLNGALDLFVGRPERNSTISAARLIPETRLYILDEDTQCLTDFVECELGRTSFPVNLGLQLIQESFDSTSNGTLTIVLRDHSGVRASVGFRSNTSKTIEHLCFSRSPVLPRFIEWFHLDYYWNKLANSQTAVKLVVRNSIF